MSETKIQLNIRSFESQVHFFNGMYNLPVAPYPSAKHINEPIRDRLQKFKETLQNELNEVDDIIDKLNKHMAEPEAFDYPETDLLTDLADWLGDIEIYCASEMVKFGIPINDTRRIIMQSNFSKLQKDGSVKYDENGKVEKGPGYWKPEPLLKDMLEELIKEYYHYEGESK